MAGEILTMFILSRIFIATGLIVLIDFCLRMCPPSRPATPIRNSSQIQSGMSSTATSSTAVTVLPSSSNVTVGRNYSESIIVSPASSFSNRYTSSSNAKFERSYPRPRVSPAPSSWDGPNRYTSSSNVIVEPISLAIVSPASSFWRESSYY